MKALTVLQVQLWPEGQCSPAFSEHNKGWRQSEGSQCRTQWFVPLSHSLNFQARRDCQGHRGLPAGHWDCRPPPARLGVRGCPLRPPPRTTSSSPPTSWPGSAPSGPGTSRLPGGTGDRQVGPDFTYEWRPIYWQMRHQSSMTWPLWCCLTLLQKIFS